MSVLLETSAGDITIDLFVKEAPKCCENFLKLCKVKYYNYSPFHTIQPNFSCQTGDPLGPVSKDSDGGTSIWGLLDGGASSRLRTFQPEFNKKLKHDERGTVSMATVPSAHDQERREAASQFLITLGDNLEYLDGKAAVFGRVVEGFDTLEKINAAYIDENGLPLKDIRIRHTIVLDEADLPDPPGLVEPTNSPVPTAAQLATVRIADDEELDPNADKDQVEKLRREREARAQALTLEMVGDLPFAEVAPPENVLFVCKLNPITRDQDLELIFSRFGKVLSCEVIRDKRTGDSLQYAFIEFAEKEHAEMAYFKMQSVLVDDHRLHVDFSQSVSKLADGWRNATNKKRIGSRGGFGGIEGLEKKRQYRAEADVDHSRRGRDGKSGAYGMVVEDRDGRRRDGGRDEPDRRSNHAKGNGDAREDNGYRHNSHRDDSRDHRRPRSRSRSPHHRKRSRSRERDRHRRPSSRDRYHDQRHRR